MCYVKFQSVAPKTKKKKKKKRGGRSKFKRTFNIKGLLNYVKLGEKNREKW